MMRRIRIRLFLRFTLIGIGLVLTMSLGQVTETRAQGPLGQILGRMDAYNKRLSSLQADLIMVKTDTLLNSSDTTRGNAAYLPEKKGRPRYIRINWTEPLTEHILVTGEDYKLYSPNRNLAYEGKTNKAQGNAKAGSAFAFIGMSAEQRRANFMAEYAGEEILKDRTRAIRVILKPKAKADFKFAEVWINKDGLPQQTRITAVNNDHTTILLTNVIPNEKVDAKLLHLTYKKGTRVETM